MGTKVVFFSCTVAVPGHIWHNRELEQKLLPVLVPLHLVTERFNILITRIHITKLDYCMQYKSFIILLIHAYFLNPLLYTRVPMRLLALKTVNKNPQKEHYGFRLVFKTQDRMIDGDGASQYIERKCFFKQVSSSCSDSFRSHSYWKVYF